MSAVVVGIPGYHRDNVGLIRSPLINDPRHVHPDYDLYFRYLLTEWTGVLRRVWALLATIDHLPMIKGEVRLTKGFLARGRIRKYLSHQTITLNVPAKKIHVYSQGRWSPSRTASAMRCERIGR